LTLITWRSLTTKLVFSSPLWSWPLWREEMCPGQLLRSLSHPWSLKEPWDSTQVLNTMSLVKPSFCKCRWTGNYLSMQILPAMIMAKARSFAPGLSVFPFAPQFFLASVESIQQSPIWGDACQDSQMDACNLG
jgi:hypothetical protein